MAGAARTRVAAAGPAGKAVSRIALLAVLLAAGIAAPARAESPSFQEYQVKAAFLYNFAKFVEWPDDAFPDTGSPIVLTVLGENPFGDALKSLKGKTVNGRPLSVRHVAGIDELERCHLLYVSPSETAKIAKIVSATKGWSLLTVGDSDGFAQNGGVINMVTQESRIAIEINPEAAQRARLKISSKLLGLAKIVKPARRQAE